MDDFSEAKSCCLAISLTFLKFLFSIQTQSPTIFEDSFLLTKCTQPNVTLNYTFI